MAQSRHWYCATSFITGSETTLILIMHLHSIPWSISFLPILDQDTPTLVLHPIAILQPLHLDIIYLLIINPHRRHPLRINILNVQIRTHVALLHQIPRRPQPQERPAILRRRPEVCDVEILVARRLDRFHVVQRTARPHGVDAPGLVVLVPRAAFLDPHGVADPFLAVFVEGVCDVLLGGNRADVLRLEFLDDLDCVEGDGVEGAHHAAIFDRPVGPNERKKVRKLAGVLVRMSGIV